MSQFGKVVCALIMALGINVLPASAGCPTLGDSKQIADRAEAVMEIAPHKFDHIVMTDFYAFCRRAPTAVLCRGSQGNALSLEEVRSIDAKVRADFEYRDDYVQYGISDVWTNDRLCGDCEDYALLVSERLAQAGQGGAKMGLVVWLPTEYTAHASLIVETADAGWVEINVGQGQTPQPLNWKLGRRLGVIWMDGQQKISAPPTGQRTKIVKRSGDVLLMVLGAAKSK
jgi:predicted transglutaminase-like cysteine proteinase